MPPEYRCEYIDTTGSVAIPPRFLSAGEFIDGQAEVAIWCYPRRVFVDRKGQLSIRRTPVNGRVFKESDASGVDGVFVDQQGERCFPPAPYEVARRFSDGLCLIIADSGLKWAYIDRSNELKITYRSSDHHDIVLEDPQDFHEGLAAVHDVLHGYGYMDKTGALAIPGLFRAANDFHEGLARVSKEGSEPRRMNKELLLYNVFNYHSPMNYGFIDHKGDYVIQPQFDYAGDFHDGLAPVVIKNKWGYIDKTGNVVIQPQFDLAGEFREGVAAVHVQPKDAIYPYSTILYWYIDKTGKRVILPEPRHWVNNLGIFSEGLAVVELLPEPFKETERDLPFQLIKAVAESWATGYVSAADKAFDRAQVLEAIRLSEPHLQPALRAKARGYRIIEDAPKKAK